MQMFMVKYLQSNLSKTKNFMQIRRNSTRKPLRTLVFAFVVTLIVTVVWLYWAHHYQKWPFLPPAPAQNPVNIVNYESPSKEQSTIGTSTKERVAEQAKRDETIAGQDSSDSIPVSITSVQPGETIYVRALIQAVTSTATCKLDMYGPDGKTYTATAPTQALAGSSTCQGFNVPMSSLVAGLWKITITVTDVDRFGTATTEKTL